MKQRSFSVKSQALAARGGVVSLVARVALVAGAVLLCGCRGPAKIVEGEAYPATLKQSRVVDVQVVRDRTRITLVNTTAQALGGRLWLNQWWSREVSAIEPGSRVTLDLREFKDRFGGAYRAGGFFATENPDKLVLTQLQSGGELVGLVTLVPSN
jgi:hypothetical protein